MVQKKKEQVSIFLAAYEGRFNEVKALVEDNNKIVNSKDEDERTPLHWAISGSKVDIAEYLIKAGSDVDAEDEV
ncbi:prosome, macropain 26S subunit, non-ATPase, 10 [Neocallimastix lanati (nom. inval.)]|nr:prosome, macropain 26S subunit, non-ATPase, 10 [Neocallimastix sp. JGI-2020a]